MYRPDCDNIYCANCKAGQGNYEHVMGFLCERCERVYDEQVALEPGGSKNPYCPICGEPKLEHEDPFPCEERTCCDTIAGEPHRSDCAHQTKANEDFRFDYGEPNQLAEAFQSVRTHQKGASK